MVAGGEHGVLGKPQGRGPVRRPRGDARLGQGRPRPAAPRAPALPRRRLRVRISAPALCRASPRSCSGSTGQRAASRRAASRSRRSPTPLRLPPPRRPLSPPSCTQSPRIPRASPAGPALTSLLPASWASSPARTSRPNPRCTAWPSGTGRAPVRRPRRSLPVAWAARSLRCCWGTRGPRRCPKRSAPCRSTAPFPRCPSWWWGRGRLPPLPPPPPGMERGPPQSAEPPLPSWTPPPAAVHNGASERRRHFCTPRPQRIHTVTPPAAPLLPHSVASPILSSVFPLADVTAVMSPWRGTDDVTALNDVTAGTGRGE